MEKIYSLPEEYDLEHARRERDVAFYIGLMKRWRARRILELGCGTGRVTIPLAESLETGAVIVGLDEAPAMLKAARGKSRNVSSKISRRIRWVKGDLRTWTERKPFDVIIAPCSTLCHLLTMENQLRAWRIAWANLKGGGRFVVDVGAPEFSSFAESLQNPSRAMMEIDKDISRTIAGKRKRLIRYRAIVYHAAEQRASVRYLYDEFVNERKMARFVSDYEHHVYYPRELELLFRVGGFEVESVWGDYNEGPSQNSSQQIVMVGRKPTK